MKIEESIDERAFRILHCSESNHPNVSYKNVVIPLIPYDGGEADKVLHLAYPSEDIITPYFSSNKRESSIYHTDIDDEREPSIFVSDRSQIRDGPCENNGGQNRRHVNMRGMKRNSGLDNMPHFEILWPSRYRSEEIRCYGVEDRKYSSHRTPTVSGRELCVLYDCDNDTLVPPPRKRTITPAILSTCNENYFLDGDVAVERQYLRLDPGVHLGATPSILRLKARKRLLELFLDDVCASTNGFFPGLERPSFSPGMSIKTILGVTKSASKFALD